MGKGIVKKVSAALLSLIVSFGTVSPVFAEEAVPYAPADTESLQSEAAESEDNNQSVQGDQNFSVSSKTTPSDSTADNAAAATAPAESSEPLEEQNTGNMQEEAGEENAGNNNNTVNTAPEVEETVPETEQNTDAAVKKEESDVSSAQPSTDPSVNDVQSAPQPAQLPVLNKAQMFSSQAILAELGSVSFKVEMDGTIQNGENNIELKPGLIDEQSSTITLYEKENNCIFKGAYLIREAEGGEIERNQITAAGSYGATTYYALQSNQYTGISLEEDEMLVLSFETKITVTVTPEYTDDSGTPTDSDEIGSVSYNDVSKGDVLELSVIAGKYHHIANVTIQVGGESLETNKDYIIDANSNNDDWQITVKEGVITGDVTVVITYAKDEPYRISAGTIQHGGIGNEIINPWLLSPYVNTDYESISIDPGKDVTFYLYSQSWTGGDEWYLNMFQINGMVVDVTGLKAGDKIDNTITCNLENGSEVTVKYRKDCTRKKGDVGKKRTVYEVNITSVWDNLIIDLNYKLDSQREMQINLNSDNGTENSGFENIGVAMETEDDNKYSYSLQVNNDAAYEAYYHKQDDPAAYNLYFFSLKPGYDPNTFDVILQYGNDDEDIRNVDINECYLENFGKQKFENLQLNLQDITNDRYNFSKLADLKKDTFQYGFGLEQNSAMMQVMTWTVQPYEYHVVCNLSGGSFSEEADYCRDDSNTDKLISTSTYTVADGLFRLPVHTPTRNGYVFKGWKIVAANGSEENSKIYGSNDLFELNETNITNYAKYEDSEKRENPYFEFVAQWESINVGKTESYSISFFKQVVNDTGNLTYELYAEQSSQAPIESHVSVLNYNRPDGDYEINMSESNLTLTVTDNSETNTLKVYYDLKSYTVTIQRKDTGYSDSIIGRNIMISLTSADGKPINETIESTNFENGEASEQLAENPITLSIPSGFIIELKNEDSLDTGYTVKYQVNGKEVPENQPIIVRSDDQVITIIYDRQISIPTGISDMSGNMFWVIATAAIGCIFVVLLNVKKKYVKRE